MNHDLRGKATAAARADGTSLAAAWRRAACILAVLVAGSAMWIYLLAVWPSSLEKLSDLYPRWYGTRELLLHHRNPYSQDVNQEIQYWIYGRLAVAGEDQGGFAYPVYVSFILWPTIYFSFAAVNGYLFWLLLLLGAGSIVGFARFVGWPRSNRVLALVVLLCACSYPIAFAARLRQLSLLVAFLLAASLVSLAKDKLALAGMLLALVTIKPQLTLLLAPWLFVWTLSDWSRRRRLLWSFAISLVILGTVSELLVRGWMPQFLHSVSAYVRYTHASSILYFLLTGEVGTAAVVLLVAIVAAECWRSRSNEAVSLEFIFCTALVLAVTLIVIPTLAPHGQLLLLPGIFLLLDGVKVIRSGGLVQRDALLSACTIVAWPWVGAIGFTAVAALLGFDVARKVWLIPVSTVPLTPLVVTIALLLCRKPILAGSADVFTPPKAPFRGADEIVRSER